METTLDKYWVMEGFESADGSSGTDVDWHGPFDSLKTANGEAQRFGVEFSGDPSAGLADVAGKRYIVEVFCGDRRRDGAKVSAEDGVRLQYPALDD